MRLRRTPEEIAAAFNAHRFHDDTVLDMRISPSRSRTRFSKIVIDFAEDDTGRLKQLTFTGCANVSLTADFDVLTDNAGFGNTSHVQACCESDKIKNFLAEQIDDLNIDYSDEYDEPSNRHPTRAKLGDLSKFILFRVELFGGTLELVARNFKVNRPRPPKQG